MEKKDVTLNNATGLLLKFEPSKGAFATDIPAAPSLPLYPMTKPDYSVWGQFDYWGAKDFAALLVGINPDEVEELTRIVGSSTFQFSTYRDAANVREKFKQYQSFLSRFQRLKLFQDPAKLPTPEKCAFWANEHGVSLPKEIEMHFLGANFDDMHQQCYDLITQNDQSPEFSKRANLLSLMLGTIMIKLNIEEKDIHLTSNYSDGIFCEFENNSVIKTKDTIKKYVDLSLVYRRDYGKELKALNDIKVCELRNNKLQEIFENLRKIKEEFHKKTYNKINGIMINLLMKSYQAADISILSSLIKINDIAKDLSTKGIILSSNIVSQLIIGASMTIPQKGR